MKLKKTNWMRALMPVLCLLLAMPVMHAQEVDDKKNRNGEIEISQWRKFAADKNLTYAEIVRKTDSLFAIAGKTDTAEDGESMRYARWKLFWQNRANLKTGKLHSFSQDYLANMNSAGKLVYWREDICEDMGNPWSFVGPKGMISNDDRPIPHLGRVNQVVVNPSNRQEMYICHWWGGLWKTTDGGANWINLTDNTPKLKGLGISNFAVDFSRSPHIIYACIGTMDDGLTDNQMATIDLYVSTDDGTNFHSYGLNYNWGEQQYVRDIKVHPDHPDFVFLTTKYTILRLQLTGNVNPGQMPNMTSTMLLDYSSYVSSGGIFDGFNQIAFVEHDPVANTYPMFVNTKSSFYSNAMLFRTMDCVTLFPVVFSDITDNISTTAFNNKTNDAINGDFTNTDPNNPNLPANWHSLSFSGSIPWQLKTSGTNKFAACSLNTNASSTVSASCLEKTITAHVGTSNYNAEMKCTINLPPNTRLIIKLVDITNDAPWNNDFSCNNPGMVRHSQPIYDTYNDLSFTHNTNYPITINTNLNGGHNFNRLVFNLTFENGYIANGEATIDNVEFNTANFYTIAIGSFYPSDPAHTLEQTELPTLFSMINHANNNTVYVQKSTDYGQTWTNMGNITDIRDGQGNHMNTNWGQLYDKIEPSKINPNRIYYNLQTLKYFDNGDSGPSWILQNDRKLFSYAYSPMGGNDYVPTHADVRSLAVVKDGTDEYVFAGHDGGLAVSDPTTPGWNSPNGSWTCATCSGIGENIYDCSQSYGVAADIFNGDVMVSAFDNGFMESNIRQYDTWRHKWGGDGWFIKKAKRPLMQDVIIANTGGGETQDLSVIDAFVNRPNGRYGPVQSFGSPANSWILYEGTIMHGICEQPTQPHSFWGNGWYTRPKTTYSGEYYADVDVFRLDLIPPAIPKGQQADFWWTNLTTGKAGFNDIKAANPNRGLVSCIAAHPHNADFIIGYAAAGPAPHNQNTFFYTTDGGNTWIHSAMFGSGSGATFHQDFPGGYATDMCVAQYSYDPHQYPNAVRAWAAMGGYSLTGTGVKRVYEGIYDGANGPGWSWYDYSTGLPDGPVSTVVFDDQSGTLFAATDVGVFSRKVDFVDAQNQLISGDPEWQCFSKNLPNSIVTDLEINYCTGKLYASCYGRGVWEADLPSAWHFFDPANEANTEVITGQVFWNNPNETLYKEKTIIVESGAKLTIMGCTVSMARGKHIVVNPGGVLVVDNAVLTNECNRMWGGIIIEGDPNQHQLTVNVGAEQSPVQGLVILRNNSTIENAYVGVYNGGAYYDGDDFPQYVGGKDGGFLHATNTTFRNCRRAITFQLYTYNQGSVIDNCIFEGTNTLNNEVYTNYDNGSARRFGPKDFIAIWACNGVTVKNSIFRQVLSTDYNPDIDLRGVAIISSDAGYTVEDNTFTNVSRGVCALGFTGNGGAISIKNNTFRDVWRSISSRMCRNVSISGNVIDVGESLLFTSTNMSMEEDEAEGFCLNACGIFVSHTDEFIIIDNTISEFTSTPVPLPTGCQRGKMGIVINATNDDPLINNNPGSQHAYRVYRNTLSTDYGIIANQDCRGVQIRCNDLQQVEAYGIEVSDYITDNGTPPTPGQLSDQGYCLTGTTPAGNMFNTSYSHGTIPPCTDEHMFVLTPINSPAFEFEYSHHNIAPFIPMCYNASTMQATACPQTCAGGPACCPDPPVIINPPEEDGKMISQEENVSERLKNISVLVAEAEQKLLRGDDAGLYSALNTADNSGRKIRDILLSAGPVLSDSVLITAINRAPAMDYMDIKAVLVANGSLPPTVWIAMANRYPALATDKEMIEAQKHQSPRKIAEGQLLDLAYEKGLLTMQQIIFYSKNSQWQEIAELYEVENKPHMALPYYIKMGNLSKARDAADKFGDEDYRNLIKMQIDRLEKGRGNSQLSANEKEFVERIASKPNEFAGEAARSLFWITEGYIPRELMPIFHETDIQRNDNNENLHQKGEILIYPNPAKNSVTITVKNGLFEPGTVISVFDITGRRLTHLMPEPKATLVNINTSGWISGVYMVNIKKPNGMLINQKLVIAK